MSFMTTTMSAPPISESDRRRASRQLALSSGWTRDEIRWEELTEDAISHWQAGRRLRARVMLQRANWIATRALPQGDRRRATSLVNLAIAAGPGTARAQRMLAKADALWDAAEGDLDRMEVRPRSRSSLFHLRMEARHRETFLANARTRIGRIVTEASETLASLRSGAAGLPHRHASRWRGEKPPVYDDMRRILSACLLIID